MNIQNISDLKQVQNNNKLNNGNFIGSILSWKIEPNTLVDSYLLIANFAKYQIPGYLEPKQIKPLSVFRKAVYKANQVIKKDGLMLREIKQDKDNQGLLIGLVQEEKKVDEQRLKYDNLGTIHYENQVINSNLDPLHSVLLEVKKWFDFYNNFTNEDVSKMLVQFANREGIRIQPRGGSYFLPATNQDLINRLKDFVSVLHPNNKISTFDIYGTGESQSDLIEIVELNLEKEINELLTDSAVFLNTANPAHKKYENGLKARRLEAKLLEKKLSGMQSVLSLKTDSISNVLNQLKQTLSLNASPNNVLNFDTKLQGTDLQKQVGF